MGYQPSLINLPYAHPYLYPHTHPALILIEEGDNSTLPIKISLNYLVWPTLFSQSPWNVFIWCPYYVNLKIYAYQHFYFEPHICRICEKCKIRIEIFHILKKVTYAAQIADKLMFPDLTTRDCEHCWRFLFYKDFRGHGRSLLAKDSR